MGSHKFDIDKHALDQELRDRIRTVIRGLKDQLQSPVNKARLENVLANLQPIKTQTNIERLEIGEHFHWDIKTHSAGFGKWSCVLTLLRQLIINFWDYLLEGADESLKSDGQIEDHLETLEDYVEFGLDDYVVVGDERHGYWLMWKDEYRKSMEEVR